MYASEAIVRGLFRVSILIPFTLLNLMIRQTNSGGSMLLGSILISQVPLKLLRLIRIAIFFDIFDEVPNFFLCRLDCQDFVVRGADSTFFLRNIFEFVA
jgi:hypothetical protein